MSVEKFNYTPEQEAAIKYRGGSLLVSAAAGSGKTRVLVERLLSHVMEGNDINEFLVITYTRAAAAELRERIYDEILERVEDAPDNRRMRRQLLLCRGAPIDTIHGFCTDVLRENAHLAALPPDFRVADESESEMIKAEVLEDVLNAAYERAGDTDYDGFRELVDTISAERDDRKLAGIVLDAYSKLRSDPDPQAWIETQIDNLSLKGISDVSETPWGAHLMEKARRTAAFWRGEMNETREEMRAFPEFDVAYGACFEAAIADIGQFLKALDASWDEARRYGAIDFSRVKPKRIPEYEDLKAVRIRCRETMKRIATVFGCTSEENIEDMQAVAPAMAALMRLIMEFDEAYNGQKRKRGVVDFSDLEHLALSLLTEKETGGRTVLAQSISRRFKEIMVDEYQDVNAVQESIFNAVSRDGSNIFMVGDVKQSIYRFRLADPSIFLAKYREYGYAEQTADGEWGARGGDPSGGGEGAKILLSRNFRSQAGILEAVNLVFSKIMSVEFGEMDYTEREKLIPGREDGKQIEERGEKREGNADCLEASAEFDIIDLSGLEGDEDEESPAKRQIEAQFIAKRIAELTGGGYTIPDGDGGARRIKYSDIVILMRSIQNKAWQYAAALTEYGIPVDLPGGEGFFETAEIMTALSILAVIDNPLQDIPLAAALNSPAYGFSADDLAMIRACSRGTDYYHALLQFVRLDNDAEEEPLDALRKKCAEFLEDIDAMRMVMPDMPADRFIWHVYNKTGLLGCFGVMNGGGKRRNNLIKLAEHARAFEKNGYKGLFSFLAYIRGLQERGAEFSKDGAAAAANAAAPEAVRIMSIHKSKGLEFPVVFLADATKRFNYKDTQKPLVIHNVLGAGPKRTDRRRRIEYTTLARMAIQEKLTYEMLAEEMRVLYVAMTRAREKLIVTAAFNDAQKEIDRLAELSRGKIAPQILEEIKYVAGWIILALSNGKREFEYGKPSKEDEKTPGSGSPELWDIRLVPVSASGAVEGTARPPDSSGHISGNAEEGRAIPDSAPLAPDSLTEDVELLRKRFSFIYPNKNAPDLPSKLTVTELKGRAIDGEIATDAAYAKGAERKSAPRPGFIAKKEGLTAAERGTALHRAMQHIELAKCASMDGIENELLRMESKGFLTAEEYAAVDAKKIKRFFDSGVGKRLLKSGNARREFKFSLLCPAERFFPEGGDDEVLLQGVVDCFFEEADGLVLIDFKTDRVTRDTIEERAKYYEPQLAAYAEALERITGKKVKDRIVYFLAADDWRPIANE